MLLVQYPDSDSDDAGDSNAIPAQAAQTTTKPALKRKRPHSSPDDLPPLPPTFHDLYATNARVSTADDPSLHGGRKRAVPHVQGNWPSHIYLEWIPSQTEADRLHNLIDHVKEVTEREHVLQEKSGPAPNITSSLQSELGVQLPLHISLSRTLQIKTHYREAFLETLKTSLRKAAVRAFDFEFLGLKWVPNFERNRWFLVLSIKKPNLDELNRLLIACNEAALKSDHGALYTGDVGDGPMAEHSHPNNKKTGKGQPDKSEQHDYSRFFHISIAWNLTEPDPALVSIVEKIEVHKYIQSLHTIVDAVKARIGNLVHKIDLGTKRGSFSDRRGSFGLA